LVGMSVVCQKGTAAGSAFMTKGQETNSNTVECVTSRWFGGYGPFPLDLPLTMSATHLTVKCEL